MKINSILFIIPLSIGVASCQEVVDRDYSYKVAVVDEEGTPVEDANVRATRHELIPDSPIPVARSFEVNTSTDPSGVASFSFSSPQTPGGVAITKDGYYHTTAAANWVFPEGFLDTPGAHVGKMATTKIEAVLKPVKNPIPMIVHPSTGFRLGEIGVEYAFDLEVGELLPPHGNGKHPDVVTKLEGRRIDNGPDQDEDVNFHVTIRFSNPLDGFHGFEGRPQDGAFGSALVSDHVAPAEGYQPSIELRAVLGKFLVPAENWDYLRSLEKQAYYFRVRTKTDESGNIISAHYGKIYGPVRLIAGKKRKVFHPTILEASLSMKEVYFNPTANDRNVEFDTKENLRASEDANGSAVPIFRP